MTPVTTQPIAPLDLAAERAELGPALEEAALRVLRSGVYVLGPEVEAFEREFAALHRVPHGIGVASGTDALFLALKALGIGAGDTVVTSPFTFFASAAAIAWVGARPVFADIDPRTALIDVEAVERAIDERTRAVLPVHLYGQMADVGALRGLCDRHGLALIEDAAQAHGATRDGLASGAVGDVAAFSFYPTKNLGAAGEGGLLLARDADLARRLRELRDHGSTAKYVHGHVGTNSRLQALQAALLRVKLPHLERWNERRRRVAALYDAAFAEGDPILPIATAPGARHVRHQYAVRVRGGGGRDVLREGLAARGIAAAVHYPIPVHLQEAARSWGFGRGDLPQAEALAREVLCLPVHPFLSDDDVERVAGAVLEVAAGA